LGFQPEYKHAYAVSKDIGSGWLLAAATKRGRMHAHHGTFREDAFHDRSEKNFSFFCACDGAGSSKLSRIGSEYTAQHLSRVVGDDLLEHESDILTCSQESLPRNLQNVMHHGVAVVAELLVALAAKAKLEPKDLRCTILTVLHYRHPTGGIFICGNVGDGFIAVKRKGKPAERVGSSDSGAFSGEVLCFMPDHQVGEFYRDNSEGISPIPEAEVESFMLCTDGVEDPFFPIHRTVDEIHNQITQGFHSPIKDVTYPQGAEPSSVIHAASPGEELLKWLSFEKRGENDDRTIVFAYRKSLVTIPKKIGSLENKSASGDSDVPAMETKPNSARESAVSSANMLTLEKGSEVCEILGPATSKNMPQMKLKPRKRYTAEFKAQAVEQLDTGKPVTQLAEELCISGNLLYNWRLAAQRGQAGSEATRGLDGRPEADGLRLLLRENAILRQENDILKNAAVILGTRPQPISGK
jgi:transposase-like protein/serine/threonine protein phosphatase PrpC